MHSALRPSGLAGYRRECICISHNYERQSHGIGDTSRVQPKNIPFLRAVTLSLILANPMLILVLRGFGLLENLVSAVDIIY